MSGHARLSPSASHRWSHCTASVRAIEQAVAAGRIPADESNDAADEGTAAHQVRQDCLELGLEPHDFIGGQIEVNGKMWPVTEEMADALQPGIDWIRERVDGTSEPLFEEKVSLEPWLPGQFGTVDCGFARQENDHRRIILVLSDLKYGFTPVEAERNPQQMIYALGLLERIDTYGIVDEIEICIDQPRKGGIKVWRCSKAELLEFGDWIAKQGAEALEGGVHRPSKDACEWCPLRFPGLCAARDQWLLGMVGLDDLEDLDTPPALEPPVDLTPERRAYLIEHTTTIKKWLGDIYAASSAAAHAGNPDPGTKLVLGDQGDRAWRDEAKAKALLVEALGDGAYQPAKLKSVAMAETDLKPKKRKPGNAEAWAELTKLITRSPARPVLVQSNDKRPEYRPLGDVCDLEDL